MQKSALKTGGEILYRCPRCEHELSHTILAMVGNQPARIRCNTCKSERNYRRKATGSTGGTRKTIPAKERGLGQKARHHSSDLYRQKLQESLMKTPYPYNIEISPESGDVIEHKKFGKGVVLKVIPPDRCEIIFQDETRALACRIKSQ